MIRAAALLAPALALACAVPALGADERRVRADLDGDPSIETVVVRTTSHQGFPQSRVVVRDPDAARTGLLGPRLDRIGRLAVRDFARRGLPQIFMDGSSGASGRLYAAALGRWDGARVRVMWRYSTARARGTVGSALATPRGRVIRLYETLVPAGSPTCCPAWTRARVSRYTYRPAADRYLLTRRVLGPRRPVR